ncbi:hypothetical protein [Aquabacter spiritensis]|uniref:TonB-like protein n=1 Tax=Aquabacter spiritensis TaxID=933073 RepID=A0A4R3M3F6_9HYPH|nr:hypothetical protein [Aquabacter spiritensis]TCT05695.1 hypothetical protein EDC64_104254 [Aquabacter spiritensis]
MDARPVRSAALWSLAAGLAGALLCVSAQAQAPPRPAQTMADLGAAFQACWTAPEGAEGSHITLRFGITAKGALKGPPLATHSHLTGDAAAQRAFVAAALSALAACTPIAMSPDLARVVASRVLTVTYRAVATPREIAI